MEKRRFHPLGWRAGPLVAMAMATVMLSGCLGSGPDIKTQRVMDNFKKDKQERIVVDRNYQVGQRFRVEPGQVMIRNKLYTLVNENAGAYRAEMPIGFIGDGQRIDIAEGTQFRVADRMLVNGRLANLMALPAPPPAAPDVNAIFANEDGFLAPAVLRGGKLVTFAEFTVMPEKAKLSPVLRESVKTSAGYVNYDVIYHGNVEQPYKDCKPLRAPGSAKTKAAAPANCGSGLHLDLSLVQYDPLQLDRIKSHTRSLYPVLNKELQIPGLKVTIHEATPVHVVFEVTKDDNAYAKPQKY